MTRPWIKPLFLVAAFYEVVLGVAFFSAPGAIFDMFAVTPPNHMAYVQFPALLLILFGIMFYRIAMDPIKNRELILYGSGLKVAYCSMTFGYALTTGIPSMWMPWAWADLAFLTLFAVAYRQTGRVTR